MTYDGLPIIDWAPECPNLVLVTEHGMTGLSIALSTGKLVVELIDGIPPHIDPAPFEVEVFKIAS